jgi:hypothetical protein
MVRAVDTGVVNVSNLNISNRDSTYGLATRERAQLSLAVQESADKLRILADFESTSKEDKVPA